MEEEEIHVVFGNEFQTRGMVRRFLDKREKIEEENEEKYMGDHYDPRFLEIDRIIDSVELDVPTSHLGGLRSGKAIGLGENEDGKMVPFSRIEMFLVKWRALSYSQCSWEIPEDVQNEMALAQYRRFNRERVDKQKPIMSEEERRVFEARAKHWYSVSPMYKNQHKLRDYQVAGVNWMINAW